MNKIEITTHPNAVKVRGKNRSTEIVRPLKTITSQEIPEPGFIEDRNIIHIKSLVDNSKNDMPINQTNGKLTETIIAFTDQGLYELTIALVEYHKKLGRL